ncbi:protein of unknown function [Streptomyces sp. KY75]|nr:protein of unknown function [Streptomyces sp. KY70]CAD5975650.1 protein of unknown function [Streptomyces sp. KY75]
MSRKSAPGGSRRRGRKAVVRTPVPLLRTLPAPRLTERPPHAGRAPTLRVTPPGVPRLSPPR